MDMMVHERGFFRPFAGVEIGGKLCHPSAHQRQGGYPTATRLGVKGVKVPYENMSHNQWNC